MAERSEAAPPAGPMIGFGLYRFRDCVGGCGGKGPERAAKEGCSAGKRAKKWRRGCKSDGEGAPKRRTKWDAKKRGVRGTPTYFFA